MRLLLALALFTALGATAAAGVGEKVWFVFLVRGDGKRPADASDLEEMQAAHIDNFKVQYGLKKLLAAGPVQDSSQRRRGIVVLKVKSKQDVMNCFKTDPFVQGGIMNVEAHQWTLERGQFERANIDPEKISENRLLVIAPGPSDVPAERAAKDAHRKIWKGPIKGLAVLGPTDDRLVIAIIEGTDDAELKRAIAADPLIQNGNLTAEIIPLWMARGTVKARP